MEGATLDTWIQSIITMIITVLGCNAFWAWLQSKNTKKTARDRMILGLGHAEIFRTAERYIHRGAITVDELEDLEKYLYKPYSELGGNGTASAIVEQCKHLKIVSTTEAEKMDSEKGANNGNV